jgi:hypothetical protein
MPSSTRHSTPPGWLPADLTRADIDTFELSDLAKLPIMTKNEMMANFDDVVTDRRLTRALVERHITDSAAEPSLILGDYVCLASGGSSGLRGTYVQTPAEYVEFGVTCFRRAMARFLVFGGKPADGLVVGMVGAALPIHSTGFAASVATRPPIRFISAPATMPTECVYWSMDSEDGLAIADFPDSVAVSAVQTAIIKTGAFKSVDTHELLTELQLRERLVLARDATEVYEAPGQSE